MNDRDPIPSPQVPPQGAANTEDERGSTRKRLLGVALLLALLAALLMCLWPTPGLPFDYLRVKAEELGRDRARVLGFVREEVVDLPYRGDVKGALGTLWEGAGSPEEKLALAQGLLAHCPGAAPTSLEELGATPAGDVAQPGLTVLHRALLAQGEVRETEVYRGSAGALVGAVHSVRVLEPGVSVVEVAGAAPKQVKAPVADAVGEELVFRLALPGRGDEVEVVRELWRAENRVGLDAQGRGDVHAFTVWPCRIGDYVREKEDLRLQESGRFETQLGVLYRHLLDFAHASDQTLGKVEAAYGVRARFDQPRILMLSRVEHEGAEGFALDLRHDDVTFTGSAEDAWQAANARGWLEAEFEGRFLREALEAPVTTAWTVFQRLQDTRPDAPGRRLRLAGEALGRLARRPGWRAVRFRAGGDEGPVVTAVRGQQQGVELSGPALPPEAVTRLAAELKLPFDAEGRLAGTFPSERLGDAALAIESALLTAEGSPGPRYALRVEVERAPELVVEGARFAFAQEGREHAVTVAGTPGGALELDYTVRRGVQVVRGTRTIAAQALGSATRHNPHYGRGESAQEDATSFCVSRAVAASLRRGEPAPLQLLAQQERELGAPATAREVAWEGALEPRGRVEVEVRVNGQPTALPALKAGLGERELLLLDDPGYAVGPLGQLTEVHTGIPARLVDEEGVGFSGVEVEVGDARLTTDVDGWILIPPGAPGVADVHSARLVASRTIDVGGQPQPEPLGAVGCDLSAPGIAGLVLTLPRPKVDVRLIEPAGAAELEELRISEQVKRHARRMLARGRTVAIPARMLDAGWGGEIAFFAHHPTSGNLIGVSEDGLHGATSNFASLRNEIQSELMNRVWEAREDLQKDGVHPIHMIRGVVVAFGVYATCRLKGMEHDEIVRYMLDQMEAWEQQTNVFGNLPDSVGDTEAGGLVSQVGNANGATSFYLGYLTALAFLHEQMGR